MLQSYRFYNIKDFKARWNHGYHLVFSVKHGVSYGSSILVSFWSGCTAEDDFRLKSANNWSPQKVSEEVSSTHSS